MSLWHSTLIYSGWLLTFCYVYSLFWILFIRSSLYFLLRFDYTVLVTKSFKHQRQIHKKCCTMFFRSWLLRQALHYRSSTWLPSFFQLSCKYIGECVPPGGPLNVGLYPNFYGKVGRKSSDIPATNAPWTLCLTARGQVNILLLVFLYNLFVWDNWRWLASNFELQFPPDSHW